MKNRMAVFLAVLVAGMSITGVATALRSYHGSDYSEDFNAAQQVRACDKESDGNSVYASFQRRSSGHVDTTPRTGSCVASGVGARIYRHRVCEDLGWAGSRCGNNRYP